MLLSFPPKNKIFYEITLRDRRFAAAAEGDPYVTDGDCSIPLGHAAHVFYLAQGHDHRFKGPGWYVCKYGPGEIKFSLPLFGESDARDFADSFGMAFNSSIASQPFASSPAGEALAEYFRRYPRRLQRCYWNYLPSPVSSAA